MMKLLALFKSTVVKNADLKIDEKQNRTLLSCLANIH